MTTLFLGPAGVPIASKDRSTLGGIKCVAKLGLNAFECEFVRGVKMNSEMAEEIGRLAKNLNIQLTVHAPYFINLLSNQKLVLEASKKRILDSLDRAERMNAKAVVVHAGYYAELMKEKAFDQMKEVTKEILESMKDSGIKNTRLAYETMAKESQFADLEELLKLVKEIKSKQLTICMDFAHIFARNGGKINYTNVLEKVKDFDHIYSHFSNMKYNINTKRFADVHMPINSHPPFKPLAQEIIRRKVDITIISESPLLEQDSLKMAQIFKNLGFSL